MGRQTWLLIVCLFLGCFAIEQCRAAALEGNEDERPDDSLDYQGDDYDYGEDDLESEETALPTDGSSASKAPPFFDQSDASVQAKPGDTVMLNCDIRNFQINNVVIWYKNTTIVTNGQIAINNRIEALKNNSILINNVLSEDADDYYCEVLPQKIRLHVALKVGGRLAIFCDGRDVTDRSLTFKQGETHKFECKTFLPTETEIKWSFNGQRMDMGVSEDISDIVLLENVDEDDAGTYQCLGEDRSHNPPHGMVTIDVHYSPKVSTHRHHVNANTGSNAELYCDYKANPIAINHWLKDGKILKFSNKYSMKDTVHKAHNRTMLTVRNVNLDDRGIYVCQVENSIGLNEVKINLGYEPETPQFEDMTVDGNTVTLHWLVRSLQPLSEAVLDYRLSGLYSWSTVSVIHTQRHSESSGVWKLTHHMELAPGVWHARVKTKNTYDWSNFSPQHDFVIKAAADDSNNIVESEIPPDDLVMAGIGVGRPSNSSGVDLRILPSLVVSAFIFSRL